MFCGDDELGYNRSRTRFAPGQGLALDESYRLAHLPLVAPAHPRVIARREGTAYDHGRHPRVHSLALPVPWASLAASDAFRDLEHELTQAAFAARIDWSLMARRQARLHATICGALGEGPNPPLITPAQRGALAGLGPLRVELRGLFSGNVNVGRLYLRAYPERRDGHNMFRRIQRILGRRETDLYVVGLYNLVDDLDADDAAALARLIDRWWDRAVLRLDITSLWLMWAMDDLVLDAGVSEILALERVPD